MGEHINGLSPGMIRLGEAIFINILSNATVYAKKQSDKYEFVEAYNIVSDNRIEIIVETFSLNMDTDKIRDIFFYYERIAKRVKR